MKILKKIFLRELTGATLVITVLSTALGVIILLVGVIWTMKIGQLEDADASQMGLIQQGAKDVSDVNKKVDYILIRQFKLTPQEIEKITQ